MEEAQQSPAQPQQDAAQTRPLFLNAFSRDIAYLILAKLPLNAVKKMSLVSRGDYAHTNHFFSTAMATFWRPERVQATNHPVTFRYHYSCATYYVAFSEPKKHKALMRFFGMMMLDLVKTYGDRLNQCVRFNRKELPGRLQLTCKNKNLLLDISEYLLKKFNLCLEFPDANNTTQAVITRKQVEKHCTTRLFQIVVYDFLKPAEFFKISRLFVGTTLFVAEQELRDRNSWPVFNPSVYVRSDTHILLRSDQAAEFFAPLLLRKLYYLADDIPTLLQAHYQGDPDMLRMDLRHFETQPGFFTQAVKFIQPVIQRILQENIPPLEVETALETGFAEYEKLKPEAKSEKCCVM